MLSNGHLKAEVLKLSGMKDKLHFNMMRKRLFDVSPVFKFFQAEVIQIIFKKICTKEQTLRNCM